MTEWKAYLKVVKELIKDLGFKINKISRSKNTSADTLAALASTTDLVQRRIISVESIDRPSISLPKGDLKLALSNVIYKIGLVDNISKF